VARRAVRESLVLLKNDGKVLPIAKSARRIHVAGTNADDLGNQSGGWTISWQGQSGPLEGGTTILQGIRAAVGSATTVTYDRSGAGAAGADLGIVVVGEKPYAEMMGDREDLGLSKEDVSAVAAVKQAGIPVVVVVVSGRPLILGDVAASANAIVAAWLPGSEGAGVADVLVGAYKPSGKLPFTWPRSMAQIPSTSATRRTTRSLRTDLDSPTNRGSGVQRFRGSEVQRFRGSRVSGHRCESAGCPWE
jgi:beta-glucosidase